MLPQLARPPGRTGFRDMQTGKITVHDEGQGEAVTRRPTHHYLDTIYCLRGGLGMADKGD
jgi:hypothetical protein